MDMVEPYPRCVVGKGLGVTSPIARRPIMKERTTAVIPSLLSPRIACATALYSGGASPLRRRKKMGQTPRVARSERSKAAQSLAAPPKAGGSAIVLGKDAVVGVRAESVVGRGRLAVGERSIVVCIVAAELAAGSKTYWTLWSNAHPRWGCVAFL